LVLKLCLVPTEPMKTFYPGGLGPWFVAMLVNVSDKHKKHTHILAHTYPDLAIDVLNKGNKCVDPTGNANFWIILMKVGPFLSWSTCLSYLNMWAFKTRGQSKRIEYGVELYLKFCEPLRLTLWVQTKDKTHFQVPRSSLVPIKTNYEMDGDDEKQEEQVIQRLKDLHTSGRKDLMTISAMRRQKVFQ
jgi:hypothetical protein